MKFYYNDKLVRTSSHAYTHAVIDTQTGELIGCRTSKKNAESIISSEISRCMTGIKNSESHLKAIQQGKRLYRYKYGRKYSWEKVEKEDSVETCQRFLDGFKKHIEYVENNWKVVELEAREA